MRLPSLILAAALLPFALPSASVLAAEPVAAVTPAAGDTATPALIRRLIPAHADRFVCERIPAEGGRDVYEIESRDGRIVLRGNTAVAAASGLYHYLKECCHAHVSWNGDQLALPATLPSVPGKIRVVAPVADKMAYNYCTHGYTMPWWDWPQWERELDWLALHGVNMALIIEGQEAVWQNTFTRFGYTKEEMRLWLSSPAHVPWQFMQNLEGLLPPPQHTIDRRVELGQKIVARCRELGIRPILQGYYGMVPWKFTEKFPDAKVVAQGNWGAKLRRPDMLHIADPRFAPIAAAFLEEQRKLFGDCHHFAADPFHEGGKTGGMKRGEVYRVIQDAIVAFDPQAVVVKQCWQASNKEMFDAGDKAHSLALDLWCEVAPYWPKAKGYDGTPWLWCLLHNFGGNLGMEANLPRLVADFRAVLASPERGKLAGLGLVPEGSWQNPVVYELMTEMGWRGAPADLPSWIRNYTHARYGASHPGSDAAWALMLESNYAHTSKQAPLNSVITAAPTLDPGCRGRRWAAAGAKARYDETKLVAAWGKMLEAAPALGATDTYRFDLADIGRQVMCNRARDIHTRIAAAHKARDLAAFDTETTALLTLIDDLDTLTGTRREWLLGKWVADARRWGDTPAEKAYFDRAARMLLTNWALDPWDGPDYANREWNGLLRGYYRQRWVLFTAALRADLAGTAKFDAKVFGKARTDFELSWIASGSPLPAEPTGDVLAISRAMHAKYGK